MILDGADVLDSYAGNIEINEATLRINTGSSDVVFNGTFGGIDGNIAKSGSGSLTLTSNSSAYDGNTIIEAGQLIISASNALGPGGNDVKIEDGGTLAINSGSNLPTDFQFYNNIEIGSAVGSSAEGAELHIQSGSAQIVNPIGLKGNSISLDSDESVLLWMMATPIQL